MKPYYERNGIIIYHGDCREVIPTLPMASIGLVLTDPPYGISWTRGVNHKRASKAHSGINNDEDTSIRDEVLSMLAEVPVICFGSFYAPYPENVTQVLIWHKPNDSGLVGSVTGYRRDAEPIFLVGPWPMQTVKYSSVLRSVFGQSKTCTETGHPHTKPLDLVTRLIKQSPIGTILDPIILDPFMGSGTTLRASKNLGRRAIGVEIEEHYCEIAALRLSQEVMDLSS